MLLLDRASATTQSDAQAKKLVPQLVLYFREKWHTDTNCGNYLVKAQEVGLNVHQTFSYAVVHIGDIPAECMARVVGHDHATQFETVSEVTLKDPAIQADFRASGDRLFDQDQQRKRLDLIRSCVDFVWHLQTKMR